ncbi:MAG: hypothetical protein ABSA43_01395 [Candidatus Microgenomates bacterium]|jgi:hypothetical protein
MKENPNPGNTQEQPTPPPKQETTTITVRCVNGKTKQVPLTPKQAERVMEGMREQPAEWD